MVIYLCNIIFDINPLNDFVGELVFNNIFENINSLDAGFDVAAVVVVPIEAPFAFTRANWKLGDAILLDNTGICVNPLAFKFAHKFR